MEGRKDDSEKDPWHLLPWRELRDVVKVLAKGAKKYGAENWRKVSDWKNRYSSALQRHWVSWSVDGEIIDPDDNLPHLAHVVCNALFLAALDRMHRHVSTDTRPMNGSTFDELAEKVIEIRVQEDELQRLARKG